MEDNTTQQEKTTTITDANVLDIASRVLLEIPGVHSLSTRFIDGVVDGISTKFGQKRLPGLNVKHRKHGSLEINIYVNVLYGFHLHQLAITMQDKVSEALLEELQLSPVKVDVHIEHLIVPTEETNNDE